MFHLNLYFTNIRIIFVYIVLISFLTKFINLSLKMGKFFRDSWPIFIDLYSDMWTLNSIFSLKPANTIRNEHAHVFIDYKIFCMVYIFSKIRI